MEQQFNKSKINNPQWNVTHFCLERMTIKQLSATLKGKKAEKSYIKCEMNKLGTISLGNIASYFKCLKDIQTINEDIDRIRREMRNRHAPF